MTMELSMTIAIVAAAAIAEIFTALVVTVFVLVAEELEHLTVARGRMAILDLVDFVPREARVRRNGAIETIEVVSIVPGDLVLVSDSTFPADVKRVEYYRDQKLFMLVYDDPAHEGDLMHYELADDLARKVERKSSMVVIEPDLMTGRPMGYYTSLIQVGA